MLSSKWIWYLVSTAILAGLGYFADFEKFIASLSSADPLYFSLAFVFGMTFFLSNAVIWRSFLREVGVELSLWKSAKLFMGGQFMNSVTPLGQFGGEPLMAYIISDNTDAGYDQSVSSIVSADIINSAPFITFSGAALLYLSLFGSLNSRLVDIAYLVVILLVVLLAAGYFLWFEREKLENFVIGVLTKAESIMNRDQAFEGLKEKVRDAAELFQSFGKNPRHLLRTSLIAHASGFAQVICMIFVLQSLGYSPGIAAVTLTVILSSLASFSPTPGGTGTIEAAMTGLLLLFTSIPPDEALAAAVLFRLTTYWPGLPLGYLSILSLRSSKK